MPTVEITATQLVVHLNLRERLLSLSKTIRVPLGHVRGATDDDGFSNEIGIRLFGCAIPGVITAGTFRRKGDNQYVYARPRQRLVVIELADERWSRIVLGVTDARAVASDVNTALARFQRSSLRPAP